MTDRLCIYSSRFSGDLKLLKSLGKGDSSEMSVSRASGVCERRCRVFACLRAHVFIFAGGDGRGHGLRVLKYMLFLWPIISAHT